MTLTLSGFKPLSGSTQRSAEAWQTVWRDIAAKTPDPAKAAAKNELVAVASTFFQHVSAAYRAAFGPSEGDAKAESDTRLIERAAPHAENALSVYEDGLAPLLGLRAKHDDAAICRVFDAILAFCRARDLTLLYPVVDRAGNAHDKTTAGVLADMRNFKATAQMIRRERLKARK